VKATEVTAGLAESNGSLLPGLWRDSLHVTCGLTACTPPGPTLDNKYGKTLPFLVTIVLKFLSEERGTDKQIAAPGERLRKRTVRHVN